MKNLIQEINNLAAIAKKRALTKKEIKQRQDLRDQYRAMFKKQFKQKLQNIKIINTNDATKE